MNAKQVHTVIDQLQAAGLDMSLSADGRVFVNNPVRLTDDLRGLIRAHKPLLIDWLRAADQAPSAANDPANDATVQQSGLSPKLQAASKALDAQIVAADLSLTPPEQPKPKLATSNTQVPPVTQPKPKPVKHIDRAWKPLATAYYQHHGHCATCIAAGLNSRYQRCGVGASLWTGYQSAIE